MARMQENKDCNKEEGASGRSNHNIATIKLKDGTTILWVYIEPGNGAVFEDTVAKIEKMLENNWGPVLIAVDFNTKHEICGTSDNDARGQAILEMATL